MRKSLAKRTKEGNCNYKLKGWELCINTLQGLSSYFLGPRDPFWTGFSSLLTLLSFLLDLASLLSDRSAAEVSQEFWERARYAARSVYPWHWTSSSTCIRRSSLTSCLRPNLQHYMIQVVLLSNNNIAQIVTKLVKYLTTKATPLSASSLNTLQPVNLLLF